MRKNNVFCRELANARPTKELKAFFALAESLPTPATLTGSDKVTVVHPLRFIIKIKMMMILVRGFEKGL